MKTQFHIILLCLAGFAFCIGCEKATLQNEQTLQTKLQSRGDCDECPNSNQCCCGVSLHPSQTSAMLQICGSASGITNCYQPIFGSCSAFNGISYTISLNSTTNPKDPFCALISGPFCITNLSTSETVTIIITCQDDILDGDNIEVTLGPLATRCFENNGDCEIDPC